MKHVRPQEVELPRPQARLQVLVVDDSAAQRQLLKSVLGRMGLDVIAVEGAAQALHLCMSDEGADIRMVLSDWQMPGMDGPDFCRAFRQLARDDYAYFILMTSETDRSVKARGLEAGADDFVTRPLDMAELRARIKTGQRILDMQEALLHRNHEVRTTLADLTALHDALNRDLAEARGLQRAFLPPRKLRMEGSELFLRLVTSGQIGGDLVGYFPISDHQIALYSVDVSGHGIASALLTGRLAGLFSWTSRRANIAFRDDGCTVDPPDCVMTRLNEFMLQDLTSDIYFTAALAYVDTRTGRVDFCQAGHPHPLIRRASGEVERVGNGGMPVGLIPEAQFECHRATLRPGDCLLAYSDGLTECVDTWGEMLDEEGLMTLLSTAPAGTEDAVAHIEAALRDHVGIQDFEDDISMLCYRFDHPGLAMELRE